jgi:hypothetical protein
LWKVVESESAENAYISKEVRMTKSNETAPGGMNESAPGTTIGTELTQPCSGSDLVRPALPAPPKMLTYQPEGCDGLSV